MCVFSPSMHGGVPSPASTAGLSVLYVARLPNRTSLIPPVKTKPDAPIKDPPPHGHPLISSSRPLLEHAGKKKKPVVSEGDKDGVSV